MEKINETVSGYSTTQDVASYFGWTRQQVSATARWERWKSKLIGNARLYQTQDVEAYARSRIRTRLFREIGISSRSLIRSTEFDTVCPECGSIAILKPPGEGEAQAFQDYVAGKSANWPWRCEHGHNSGFDH